MAIKLAVVMALGPPAIAVLIFAVPLNASSKVNHSNINLPVRVDAVRRLLIVTLDMHGVHHSIVPSETNSNFGFNLPWWDRLPGPYLAQPRAGHDGMTIGIEQFRTRRDPWRDRLLLQPLGGPASGYPINRSGTPPEAKKKAAEHRRSARAPRPTSPFPLAPHYPHAILCHAIVYPHHFRACPCPARDRAKGRSRRR